MKDLEDEIIRLAQKGNSEYISKLTDWLYSNVATYLNYKFIANTRQFERDDVIQDSVIRTIQNIKKYSFTNKFNTWACTIGLNVMRNYLKKRKREKIVFNVDPDNLGKVEFLETYQTSDLSNHVKDALKEIPKHYSSVMVLRDIDGLTYDEISKKTGLNIGTVKSRIYRAREKVRDYFLINNIRIN